MEFAYLLGLVDLENGKAINTAAASETDAEIFGVKEQLEHFDESSEDLNGRPPRVIYEGRYEEFERKIDENREEVSQHLKEPDFEEIIDSALKSNATKLYRFFPEELQTRIDQRVASVPDIRPQNPESTHHTANEISKIHREEVEKYREEAIGNVVNYDEIKRNTGVFWAEDYTEIFYIEGYVMQKEFEGEEFGYGF